MLNQRGDTKNKRFASQGRDFTSLRYGNITPTDIDALMEIHNRCFVFIEAKHIGGRMDEGQEIALERLCDAVQETKPALLILAMHNYDWPQKINFAMCRVDRYRFKGEWKGYTGTVKQLVDQFVGRYDK